MAIQNPQGRIPNELPASANRMYATKRSQVTHVGEEGLFELIGSGGSLATLVRFRGIAIRRE